MENQNVQFVHLQIERKLENITVCSIMIKITLLDKI